MKLLLGEMQGAMAQGRIIVHNAQAIEECRQYIIDDKGDAIPANLSDETSGARKTHGDRPVAYSLAVLGLNYVKPLTPQNATPEPYSMQWFADEKKRDERANDRWTP